MFGSEAEIKNRNESRVSAAVWLIGFTVLLAITALLMLAGTASAQKRGATDFAAYDWTKVYDGADQGWAGRAGLQAVELRNRLYILGGRTPNPTQFNPFGSILWDDVWESDDLGRSWMRVAAGPVANPQDPDTIWPARGYFQAVSKGNAMYLSLIHI